METGEGGEEGEGGGGGGVNGDVVKMERDVSGQGDEVSSTPPPQSAVSPSTTLPTEPATTLPTESNALPIQPCLW